MEIFCVGLSVVILLLFVAWRVAVEDAKYAYKGWNECVSRHDAERTRLQQELKDAHAAALRFKLDRDEVRESTERLAANYLESSEKLKAIRDAVIGRKIQR